MRRPRSLLLALALALPLTAWVALWSTAVAARQGSEAHTEAVAGTLHVFFGRGGNVGLCAGADGVLLIDDQYAEMAPEVRAAVDRLDGEGDGTPRFVLNTHFHGDHTGANPSFGRTTPILAHENVRARLLQPGRDGKTMDAAGLPVVTYADGLSLFLNGESIRVVHYPAGHTDGDSVVYFEGSKVVHTGDLFFHGRFPFVDLDSGGSVQGMVEGVGKILGRIDDGWKVIPGHGPVASRAELASYRDMLVECLQLVRKALAEGKDVPAMLSEGLLGRHEALSWQFVTTERFLQTLVREVRGE